ncbi:hypothetical protein HDC90_001152 [Pedobacter sp. AK013]|nr:hypothetical protein [Pedobacter sp. AK013]
MKLKAIIELDSTLNDMVSKMKSNYKVYGGYKPAVEAIYKVVVDAKFELLMNNPSESTFRALRKVGLLCSGLPTR